MAREPRQITDAQIIDVDSENVQAQVDADNFDENAIASEFGNAEGDTSYLIKVHKFVPKSKDMLFCMDATLADLPLTPKVQQEWGEGKYRIQLFKDGKFFKRWHIAVAAPPRFVTEKAVQPSSVNDPAVISLLQELVRREPPKPEPQQKFGITEAITLLGAAVPLVVAIKDLMPKQQSTIAQVKDLLEITNQLRPNDALPDREPSIVEVIGNVLTKSDLLANLGAAFNPANAQQQQTQKQIAPPQPVTPEQQQAALMAQVRAQLAGLVECAKKNSDPDLYAAVVIDQMGAAMPDLLQQLAQPGAIEYVIMIHPPCATYRPWFEALLTSLAEQVQEGLEEETPQAAPSGDVRPVFAPSPGQNIGNVNPFGNAGDASDVTDHGETGEGR